MMGKKTLLLAIMVLSVLGLSGCGETASKTQPAAQPVQTAVKKEEGVSEARKAELEALHLKQAESIATVQEVPAGSSRGKKVLIAYFTWGGRTEKFARYIRQQTGGDLFAIRRDPPYPTGYQEVLEEAKKEVDENRLPKVAGNMPDIKNYDVVILGYPAWWFTAPRIVVSFLQQNREQLKGKLIVPYLSSYSSPFNVTLPAIHEAAPEARFLTGLTLDRNADESAIGPWLAKAGF